MTVPEPTGTPASAGEEKPKRGRPRGRKTTIREGFTGGRRLSNVEAMDRIVSDIALGKKLDETLERAGRSLSWYQNRRKDNDEFRNRIDAIRHARGDTRGAPVDPSFNRVADPKLVGFPEFSEAYLGQRIFPHMQNVVDLIEGREPSWMHPSFNYTRGEKDLLLVNVPPSHAKSTTVTTNYVVYRIVKDPSVRVVIVSKSQAMAKKMLLAIKNRLTHPQYSKLIATFAPAGGFEESADAWTTEMIYVGGGGRDVEQKDPTVQAIGIRGHLYGARADLIIMDDCVDSTNTGDYEKQIDWIQSEVMSRIEVNGALLVVGTRLATRDLYSELQEDGRYPDGASPWTVLTMPAVLEFDEDPAKWVTLWPRSNQPDERGAEPGPDGLYPKWDGPRLAKKRSRVTPRVWSRVYQQQQTAEDTIFQPEDIRGCTLGSRNVGRIQEGMPGNRVGGMDGLIILGGLDPATTGHTAMTVLGLDPRTFKRYVLDVRNKPGLHPDGLRALIYELTDKYAVSEWVIEKNGFQGFLANDTEVNRYLNARGCVVRPHWTGAVKNDPDFGIPAMSALFKGWREGNNLIELPSPHMSEGVKALVEQRGVWVPKAPKTQKTDCVMSLWFANLAAEARVRALSGYQRTHSPNPFLTRADKARQSFLDFNSFNPAAV